MKAINELYNEHHGINIMLDIMSSISMQLAEKKSVEILHLEKIVEFLSGFADKCHHGKEEDILFNKKKLKNNPTLHMMLPEILVEHETGRKIISSLKKILNAGSQANPDFQSEVGKLFADYADLLHKHIKKENDILFPALAQDIDTDMDAELFEAFEKLETDVIGLGKHEEYHAMLHEFKQIYKQ